MLRLEKASCARARIPFALAAAAATVAAAGAASATTYTNVANGAPTTTGCNLTDAVQAATTNAQVHGCAPGSSSGTDTIILRANTIYQGYGKALHVPPTGGALVIKGTLGGGGALTSTIRAPNYGYPNPLGGTTACQYPAAIFTGGTNLTVQDLTLQESGGEFTNGICQYAGSVIVDHSMIGDGSFTFGFNARGIYSAPNGNNNHRSLTVRNTSRIVHNGSPNNGAGIALFGDVTTTISDTQIDNNQTEESGAGIFWGGGWGKMGNLTLNTVTINNNHAGTGGGWGGGLYLDPDDATATVTVFQGSLQNNSSDTQTAGAIYVGSGVGVDKLVLNHPFIVGNFSAIDQQQNSFNSDPWTYAAIRCNQTGTVASVTGSEWSSHSPPLKGDGTCMFP